MSHAQLLRLPAVSFERDKPAPIDRLWPHLTDTSTLPSWYGDQSSIEPRPGGSVSVMSGHIRGVVTQCQPNRLLAYTWNVFSIGVTESQYPESILTLTLSPSADHRVLLTLLHLPILEPFEAQNAMGWHTFLDLLSAALGGQPPLSARSYMEKNAPLYSVDLNHLQR